jgi:hypothetical protein
MPDDAGPVKSRHPTNTIVVCSIMLNFLVKKILLRRSEKSPPERATRLSLA